MPSLICGLDCFAVPSPCTAEVAAQEFSASLGLALEGASCTVEVYRVERLAPDALLAACDLVMCRLPAWDFDLAALERLHEELDGLREEKEKLQVNLGRATEALATLSSLGGSGGGDISRCGSYQCGRATFGWEETATGQGGGVTHRRRGGEPELETVEVEFKDWWSQAGPRKADPSCLVVSRREISLPSSSTSRSPRTPCRSSRCTPCRGTPRTTPRLLAAAVALDEGWGLGGEPAVEVSSASSASVSVSGMAAAWSRATFCCKGPPELKAKISSATAAWLPACQAALAAGGLSAAGHAEVDLSAVERPSRLGSGGGGGGHRGRSPAAPMAPSRRQFML